MISEFINRSQQIIPLINKKKTCTLPFFINKKQPVIHFVFIDIQIFQVTIPKILIQNNKYSILSYKNSDINSISYRDSNTQQTIYQNIKTFIHFIFFKEIYY